MKTKLSPVFKEFKKEVEDNFDELFNLKSKYGESIVKQVVAGIDDRYDEIKKEVRAIVMPEESPLSITDEFIKAKTDINGVKHDTFNERMMSDFSQIKEEQQRQSTLQHTIVKHNGTLVYDYAKVSNTLQNIKSIFCIGDSVTRGKNATKNYGQYLAEKLNANVTNLAVGGATFSTVSSNNIFNQATNIKNADLVIIQGTDDDWLWESGVPIGTDKIDIKTYIGAFYQMVNLIRAQNKDVKIISMTATRQLPVNGKIIRRRDTDKNGLKFTLEDYVNAHILACTELDIPVFDAYHTNYIDVYNPAFRKFNMQDGLHPNEHIHEIIMYELLKNYYYFYG